MKIAVDDIFRQSSDLKIIQTRDRWCNCNPLIGSGRQIF